jgi:hypothetical protein
MVIYTDSRESKAPTVCHDCTYLERETDEFNIIQVEWCYLCLFLPTKKNSCKRKKQLLNRKDPTP